MFQIRHCGDRFYVATCDVDLPDPSFSLALQYNTRHFGPQILQDRYIVYKPLDLLLPRFGYMFVLCTCIVV